MADFDPDWTFEQAWAANQAALAENPSIVWSDPTLPFSRWYGAQRLQELQARYVNGDQWALMAAIRECARTGLPMPDWVATSYIRAFDTVLDYRAKSWDDVFGRPIPGGANLVAMRRRRYRQTAIWLAVVQAIEKAPQLPVDSGLFENVGNAHGISGSEAQRLYMAEVKSKGFSAADIKRRMLGK